MFPHRSLQSVVRFLSVRQGTLVVLPSLNQSVSKLVVMQWVQFSINPINLIKGLTSTDFQDLIKNALGRIVDWLVRTKK